MFRKLTVVSLSVLVALAGCQKPDPYDEATAVVLRQSDLASAGGTAFVSVTCKGAWTLAVECSDGGSWAGVSPASGSGNKGDVQLQYQSNDGTESRSLALVLKPANGKEARVTAFQEGKAPKPESFGYDVAPMDWLELPATAAGDGRDFFAHDLEGGRYRNKAVSGTRNWSCYYDYDNYLSEWVAYPLNKNLIGNGDRTDLWGYDPLLAVELQQSITTRFSSTNRYYSDKVYDRGHQIPSADRLNRKPNISTFYATNMTPQSNSFNGGIWARLEGKVRGYAGMADTLYVVTGCVYNPKGLTVNDTAGHQIPVPTAYFKALLFKGTNTYTVADGYMAAGFLLPHDDAIAGKNYLDYICSIDMLEKETGIDFFPNLEKKLGKETANKIEAEQPSKWWN